MVWWPEPTVGDIVWCHFPDKIKKKPKPRPVLVMIIYDDDDPEFTVNVAYGTKQKLDQIYQHEFAIRQSVHPAAYAAAGLSFDTKFDLDHTDDLPFSTEWFSVPPHHPYGQTPQLGILHASMMQIASRAMPK